MPLAVKGLESPLLLLPGAGLVGVGAIVGAMVVVAGLMPVKVGITVIAMDILLGAVVMLVAGGAKLGVVTVIMGLTDTGMSAILFCSSFD